MRHTGADGYAYFERDPELGTFRGLIAGGDAIGEACFGEGPHPPNLIRYPLHGDGKIDGFIAFTFADSRDASRARTELDAIVGTIASVWAASETARLYRDLIGRVNELETRLLDSKIADRVSGFLVGGSKSEVVGAIAQHVDGVLRPTQTRRVLETIVRELEGEVEGRKIATLAKGILQGTAGMTEEEAHAHLRALSRRSRRPLRAVALELIADSSSNVAHYKEHS
jgi:hypothetical protein